MEKMEKYLGSSYLCYYHAIAEKIIDFNYTKRDNFLSSTWYEDCSEF